MRHLTRGELWEIEERDALDIYRISDVLTPGLNLVDGDAMTTIVFYPKYLYIHRYSVSEIEDSDSFVTDFSERIYKDSIYSIYRGHDPALGLYILNLAVGSVQHQFLLNEYEDAQLLSLVINQWKNAETH